MHPVGRRQGVAHRTGDPAWAECNSPVASVRLCPFRAFRGRTVALRDADGAALKAVLDVSSNESMVRRRNGCRLAGRVRCAAPRPPESAVACADGRAFGGPDRSAVPKR
ncbi:hypothetical protein Acsp04_66310 [Actinomadura sp. NBRC 104425]|nr:hypothetical protein Acsp04_66310 [Actinomadura sp. NBRC 104425]